VQSSAAYTKLV